MEERLKYFETMTEVVVDSAKNPLTVSFVSLKNCLFLYPLHENFFIVRFCGQYCGL